MMQPARDSENPTSVVIKFVYSPIRGDRKRIHIWQSSFPVCPENIQLKMLYQLRRLFRHHVGRGCSSLVLKGVFKENINNPGEEKSGSAPPSPTHARRQAFP